MILFAIVVILLIWFCWLLIFNANKAETDFEDKMGNDTNED